MGGGNPCFGDLRNGIPIDVNGSSERSHDVGGADP